MNASPPHLIDHVGNILKLEGMGIRAIIGITACGSLVSTTTPGMFVVPDDFVDLTGYVGSTINDRIEHPLGHPPFNQALRKAITDSLESLRWKYRPVGTIVSIRGPRFSTLAESRFYASHGWQFINMTTAPEAAICLERGIGYASLGLVTDHDVFVFQEPASYSKIKERFQRGTDALAELLPKVLDNANSLVPVDSH